MIIFEELVYQEAQRRKLVVPASQMKQAEADFKKQFHSPDEYQQYLKVEMGGSEQNVQDKIKRSLLIEQVLKSDVEDKIVRVTCGSQSLLRQESGKIPGSRIVYLPIDFHLCRRRKPTRRNKTRDLKRANEALKQAKATKSVSRIWIAGRENFGRRFPREHGRPQGRRERQIASSSCEGLFGDEARTG